MKNCLVLLSTYNGERYLEQLINSVLIQKNVNVDILVRDDGSIDNTLKILEKYKNKHFRIYFGENLKPARSFLDLMKNAPLEYDYYALCDQDDVWNADKLETAVKYLENIEKPALYSCAVDITDKDLNHLRISRHRNTFEKPLFDIMTFGTPGCTFVFNKKLLKYLKQYIPKVCSMHDSWVSFVCLAVNGEFFYDNSAHIYYRQHDNNVLGAQDHSLIKTLKQIIIYKEIKRSDMAKEILIGYGDKMNLEIKNAFSIFASYKESLKFKIKLLLVPYDNKVSKRAFYKAKLRVLFNTI